MNSKISHINKFNPKQFDLEKTTSRITLGEVFADKNFSYLNEFTLFIAHFNSIPNCISEKGIDCTKANNWFIQEYKSEITDWHYNKKCFNNNKKEGFEDIFYFMFDDLLLYFSPSESTVKFLFRNTELAVVESVVHGIRKFRERKKKHKPSILLLVNRKIGIDTKPFGILKPKLNIDDNYNDDFKEIHQTILKRLSKKNDKGLVLLHGKPGMGKTFYIRYLISILKKDIIFLPPNMANSITNPDLISVLIHNPNSIFVIEDAERIVADRENDGHSPVSALLNISDGLLSDCLNIQIICSFNTDISKVDNALMRKGRLIAKYEFKELEAGKAQALSKKLGFDGSFNSPMTLTAIYNQQENDFQQSKRNNAIGFTAV